MNKSEHFYEACYEVWMRGSNPDYVSYDKSEDDFYNDKPPEYTASMELRRQQYNQEEENDEMY